MIKSNPCKLCESTWHTKAFCPQKPRKAINPRGKEAERWTKFRDETVIPHLDKEFGHTCRCCGKGGRLDVDHIHGKGSHPQLKYQISNFQYLCRMCHIEKTANKECEHGNL
jgi:5-methylcytosine-specific restriction endonuclease McrA